MTSARTFNKNLIKMDNTEKARELISKHLYLHGGDGLGITDGDVYRAVLDAVSEALDISRDVRSEQLAQENEKLKKACQDFIKYLEEKVPNLDE